MPTRAEHHARVRRLKRWLRFVPRRATLHRHPVMGRFADAARRRTYLWSFKPRHVRPAVYFGSILALLPVMGLQLPLALLLSLGLRANLMIAGALQLITNPLSAAPVYFATYHVGRVLLQSLGLRSGATADDPSPDPEHLAYAVSDAVAASLEPASTSTLGFTIAALLVGGTVCGLGMGVVLDLIYRRKLRPNPNPVHPAHPHQG